MKNCENCPTVRSNSIIQLQGNCITKHFTWSSKIKGILTWILVRQHWSSIKNNMINCTNWPFSRSSTPLQRKINLVTCGLSWHANSFCHHTLRTLLQFLCCWQNKRRWKRVAIQSTYQIQCSQSSPEQCQKLGQQFWGILHLSSARTKKKTHKFL